jgi:UDP-N-acetylglucosamine 2-epimerase (non-hydrolysing)
MILTIYGTRPTEIKLYPFTHYRHLGFEFLEVDQSKDLHQGLIKPEYKCSEEDLEKTIQKLKPEMVLVHGDTRSGFRGCLYAYVNKIPIIRTEAGLRTYDLFSPFPEEGYRQMMDRIATYKYCSKQEAVNNLKSEGLSGKLVGQTGIDTLYEFCGDITEGEYLIVTVHRNENYKRLPKIIKQIKQAEKEIELKIFAHPNRIGQELKKHFKCLDPMGYKEFVKFLAQSYGVMTDSGGLQEEATALGKKCFVLREKSERSNEDIYPKGATKKIIEDLQCIK